jgi:CAP12/Pycsar effector protein, TIR domain
MSLDNNTCPSCGSANSPMVVRCQTCSAPLKSARPDSHVRADTDPSISLQPPPALMQSVAIAPSPSHVEQLAGYAQLGGYVQPSPIGDQTPRAHAAAGAVEPGTVEVWELPRLAPGQKLDLEAVRVPYETLWEKVVWIPTGVVALILLGSLFINPLIVAMSAATSLMVVLLLWVSWQLFLAAIHGNSIRVGDNQYPQLHKIVLEAANVLGVTPPTVYILQGHGIFELFVARRFSRRGMLLITSNMLDDLTEHGSSRELMFFVGRQLGLIATGYFDYWFFKHTLGSLTLLLCAAWQRRAQLTADRLGLLVAGDVHAAEQAMLILAAGRGVAPNTNIRAIEAQRAELFGRFWAWIHLAFSTYPYLVDRISRLHEFALAAAQAGIASNAPVVVGALPIAHRQIRALPLMIVHGHDVAARLELENFLLRNFPHVTPMTMIDKAASAWTLAEKFERMATSVRGALAILSPDDLVLTRRTSAQAARARQNVIVELGWFWGRFGRGKCLLLVRGDVDIPSDLSGVDLHRFAASPLECSENIREFIAELA